MFITSSPPPRYPYDRRARLDFEKHADMVEAELYALVS